MLQFKCFSSCLAVVFTQSIEARSLVENEDVVGAVLTGEAPTTSECSTILLPKVHLTLEVWWYRQVSNIRRTLVGNKIVDHSDVVGAPPVGAAPTTSSFST